MKRLLIAGGSGFIGRLLKDSLSDLGYQVSILSRSSEQQLSQNEFSWNPETGKLNSNHLRNQDVIINLGGAGIADKPWTKGRKEIIFQSRIKSTRLLVQTLLKGDIKPALFINASAIGYYGNRLQETLREDSPPGEGFLSNVCLNWEKEMLALKGIIPYSILRIGIVLSAKGGSFNKLVLPLQYRMNTQFGNGQQIISWIHIADLINIFKSLIEEKLTPGIYNATAPNPSSLSNFNQVCLTQLGHRAIHFSIPKRLLQIFLGEYVTLFYDSTHALPQRLLDSNFKFKYPQLKDAIKQLL